jgi:hypothetical protein
MLSREELIDILAHLAAPLTPFTLEGAPEDDALFIDWIEQRSHEQFERILDAAVDAFIDVVTHPPMPAEYVPPARDADSWRAELLGLAEMYGRTPHERRILQGFEPALRHSGARLLIIESLGRMRSSFALARLRELAESGLTREERVFLIGAIADSGGAEARALLKTLRERFTEAEVRSVLDEKLRQWIDG